MSGSQISVGVGKCVLAARVELPLRTLTEETGNLGCREPAEADGRRTPTTLGIRTQADSQQRQPGSDTDLRGASLEGLNWSAWSCPPDGGSDSDPRVGEGEGQ